LGADEILFHDKVMVRQNLPRKAGRVADGSKTAGEVANVEIGMAVWWAGDKGLKIEPCGPSGSSTPTSSR
jgi:hypothetical protein